MKGFLDELVSHKQNELQKRKQERPLHRFQNEVSKADGSFLSALKGDSLKIIAELKPRSPSLGTFDNKMAHHDRLKLYEHFAHAVSVLCDERYFGGSVQLLQEISRSIKLPALLKDFVIDPYQIYEGRQAGAQAVLLIVKILEKKELRSLSNLISDLGMIPVIEVQTEDELAIASSLNPQLLLINNRNLDNLQIDLDTVKRLVSKLNYKANVIAASGIETADNLLSIRPYASRFLIGSALMSSRNPADKFEEFLSAEERYREETAECRK